MKRSDFITMMAGAPFLGIQNKRSASSNILEDEELVETPEKRLEYTWQLLNKLCTDIGPRPTGSKGFTRGAHIIREEMKRSLPSVEYSEYAFKKWELIEKPEFIIGGQHIETLPSFGCKGTPPEGIMGILKKDGKGFKLADTSTGEIKALITVSDYEKAITHYIGHYTRKSLPVFAIGKQDLPLIENAVQSKKPTKLKAWVRFLPKAPGSNVVGSLPGKRKEEILFIAHADTVFNSPGANDNTASVIVMLMLAHAAAKNSYDHTLTFMASDGEEFGYKGAKHYAKQRMADNTMKNIRYIVNMDSLTYGPNLLISSKQGSIEKIIRSIHRDLKIDAKPKFDNSDGFILDAGPFQLSGAKAMHVNSRGYNEKTFPVYHRPSDIPSSVPLDCTEIGFLVFNEFIKRIDKL